MSIAERLARLRGPVALLVLACAGGFTAPRTAATKPLPSRPEGATLQAHEGGPAVRAIEISPRVGPPGTLVTVKVDRMPAVTPVQLAIGATRSGFEALALALTTMDGDLEEILEVPEWSRHDQTHRFLVFNLYFSTILAESAIFHVTDADGVVAREGVIGSAGPGCPTLDGDDEERYRLTGATDGLEDGTRVQLEGTLTESSEGCGDDLSLELRLSPVR